MKSFSSRFAERCSELFQPLREQILTIPLADIQTEFPLPQPVVSGVLRLALRAGELNRGQPLVVARNGSGYRLLSGYRLYYALRLARVPSARCLTPELTGEAAFCLQFEDLPHDALRAQLVQTRQAQTGESAAEIAALLSVSTAYLERLLQEESGVTDRFRAVSRPETGE